MLVFDQLKKDDPQLRFIATVVFVGMMILLVGLWWVQVVSTREYKEKLQTQSIRTVRVPPVRGMILDRDGQPLAETRPSYNVDLYMEELSRNFQTAYAAALSRVRTNLNQLIAAKESQLHRKLTPQEKKPYAVTQVIKDQLQEQTRYEVISNLVDNLGARLQQPVPLTEKDFQAQYARARALPMPILHNLNPIQVARFEENSAAEPGMDLEVHSIRYYPHGTMAAHLLGYLRRKTESDEEDSERKFNYWLPDYMGVSGIEGLFEDDLHGTAGEKSVLVNYLGYRQSETVWATAEPGQNVVLTIDLDIQKAAEAALQSAQANVRGAVVVMDAQNGDVLAMASAPNFDPNHRVVPPDPATREKENERWNDEVLGVQKNRALYENYHPGSIFKVVVGMAGLEQGMLDPKAIFKSEGYYMVGRRRIGDTAKAGDFDFDRAMAKSSNPYFIDVGLRPGVLQKIIAIGQKLHLGERTDIMPHQETRGNFPNLKRISHDWRDGDTANLSIGQGEIDVTPIQMAVMTAAVANGGKVLWPRVVMRIENNDGSATVPSPPGRVRDNLGVSARTLRVIHEGMLADTEDPEGTGHLLKIPGWRIAGKTGTAEVENRLGKVDRSLKDTWFVSFAPEESPRYVVVATVEGGASGGLTCVPIAQKVYEALQRREQQPRERNNKSLPKSQTMASTQ